MKKYNANKVPISLKKECADMKRNGSTIDTIYKYYLDNVSSTITRESFRRCLRNWSSKFYPKEQTLIDGTYDGFIAHDATVRISANGSITEAWIKQTASSFDVSEFLEAIKRDTEPYVPSLSKNNIANTSDRMLEIPLFDMHFGIADFEYYLPVLDRLLSLISSKYWDTIYIPFGQDFFHNDNIEYGVTTKGTNIEKVDMQKAVYDGKRFIYKIVDTALEYANKVRILYTPGNHDKTVSWMFMEVLLERYGYNIVDDSIESKKIIVYGSNAIMITHGNSKRATCKNLAHIFPISFPNEFGSAKVREVHAGHLHDEMDGDIFGIMVRRLSSGNATDNWSNREDYIGSHKRFMIFEWDEDALRSIHYI